LHYRWKVQKTALFTAADLGFFEREFQLDKTLAQIELKTKQKKVINLHTPLSAVFLALFPIKLL